MNRTVLPGTVIDTSLPAQALEEDIHLIQAVASGSENAFSEVYRRYHRPIYNYLLRIVQDDAGADDILQEVFLAVWQGAAKFRQKASVKTWIYRIAYKQSVSWLRKHRRKLIPVSLDEVVDGGDSPEESAMAAMRSANIGKAMAGLTVKHRAVIELAFVQEMSYAEIAEILDCPIGTVKSRMSYALRQLNQVLLNTGFNTWEETGKEK